MFHGSTSPRNSPRRRLLQWGHAEAKATTANMRAQTGTHKHTGWCMLADVTTAALVSHRGQPGVSPLNYELGDLTSAHPLCLIKKDFVYNTDIFGHFQLVRWQDVFKKWHFIVLKEPTEGRWLCFVHLSGRMPVWSSGVFCSTHVELNRLLYTAHKNPRCFWLPGLPRGHCGRGIRETASLPPVSLLFTLFSPLLASPQSGFPPSASLPLHGLPNPPLSRRDRERMCEIKSNSSLQMLLFRIH